MLSNQRDRHNRHGTGAGNPLLSKEVPKQAVFPWQMSTKAQPQDTIANVAEMQPSRWKVWLPARLAGCGETTVRAKTEEVLVCDRRDLGMEDRARKARSYGGGSMEMGTGLCYSKGESCRLRSAV